MKRMAMLALVALAACTTAPPPIAAGPTAAFGEIARAGDFAVRPLALLEDSRCPAIVQCVWAGQVRITVEIIGPAGRETRDMTLGKPIMLSRSTVTLVDVQPPKVAPAETEPRAYRFTFRSLTLPRP